MYLVIEREGTSRDKNKDYWLDNLIKYDWKKNPFFQVIELTKPLRSMEDLEKDLDLIKKLRKFK